MSISGLVITVAEGDPHRVLDRLGQDRQLTLGERFGRTVAAVLEAGSDAEAEAAYARLVDTPGIEKVDVVCVHLDGQ